MNTYRMNEILRNFVNLLFEHHSAEVISNIYDDEDVIGVAIFDIPFNISHCDNLLDLKQDGTFGKKTSVTFDENFPEWVIQHLIIGDCALTISDDFHVANHFRVVLGYFIDEYHDKTLAKESVSFNKVNSEFNHNLASFEEGYYIAKFVCKITQMPCYHYDKPINRESYYLDSVEFCEVGFFIKKEDPVEQFFRELSEAEIANTEPPDLPF